MKRLRNGLRNLHTRLLRRPARFSNVMSPDAFAVLSLAAVADAVMLLDGNGFLRNCNPTASRLFGISVTGGDTHVDDCVVLQENDDAGAARVLLGPQLGRRQDLPADAVLIRPDGSLVEVEGHCLPVPDCGGALLVLRDVSEQRRARRWLAFQATHDNLTTLLNRSEIERRIAFAIEQVRSGGKASLLFIDIDQFKIINDSCGHQAGDEFLRRVGKVLREQLKNNEALARLGGDEFAVLVAGRSAESAQRLAESLIAAVRDIRFCWEHKVYRVSASIGIVEISGHFDNWKQVLSLADSACFMAKDHGRGRAWIAREDDDLVRQRRAEMDWVGRITGALEDDLFFLCRQQITPLDPLDGVPHWEVLTRLQEHHLPQAQPEQFIPAAERYGLMPAVDRWVVNTALRHLGHLPPAHPDRNGVTAINISGTSLSDNDFPRFIATSFKRYRVDASRICFEITETAAATDFDAALRFINSVRRLGCQISLDDFGSGFSSFSYLKAFDIDYLKIDGGFVRDMDRDPVNARFVESINNLGQSLGLATIAEYAESAAVVEQLRQLGVDYAQGNFIGRPQRWID